MNSKVQPGFTLLELLITVAVVGVLAAIALPIYQDYAVRTRVAEAMSLIAGAKNTVADNAASVATDLSQNYSGLSAAGTKSVKSVGIDKDNGAITLTFQPAVQADKTIVMVPTAAGKKLAAGTPPTAPIVWSCDGKDTTLDMKFRPTECR